MKRGDDYADVIGPARGEAVRCLGWRFPRRLLVVAAVVSCVGCGEPRLDGSSDDTLATSSDRLGESLDEPQRKAFEDALAKLEPAAYSEAASDDVVAEQLRQRLDGMTAAEVIAEADKYPSYHEMLQAAAERLRERARERLAARR